MCKITIPGRQVRSVTGAPEPEMPGRRQREKEDRQERGQKGNDTQYWNVNKGEQKTEKQQQKNKIANCHLEYAL